MATVQEIATYLAGGNPDDVNSFHLGAAANAMQQQPQLSGGNVNQPPPQSPGTPPIQQGPPTNIVQPKPTGNMNMMATPPGGLRNNLGGGSMARPAMPNVSTNTPGGAILFNAGGQPQNMAFSSNPDAVYTGGNPMQGNGINESVLINPNMGDFGINTPSPTTYPSGIDSYNPVQAAFENYLNDFLLQNGEFAPLEYYPGQTVANVSPATADAISGIHGYTMGAGMDAANNMLQHGLNAQAGTAHALDTAYQLMQGGGIRDIGSQNIGSQTISAMNINAPENQVTAQEVSGPTGTAALMDAAQLAAAPTAQAAQLGDANLLGDQQQVNAQTLSGLNQDTINQVMNNPALSGAIDASLRDVQRNLTENILPSNAMAAIGAGGAGSSRRAVMDAISTRGAADRMADIASTMRANAFNQGIDVAGQQALANQGTNLQGQLANQSTGLQAALANQAAQNTYGLQNAAYQQQANLANQAMAGQYGLTQGQFNQAANMANQAAMNEMTGLNMGYNMQGQLANQASNLQAQTFNNQQALQASMANQQANLAASQSNQASALQAAQANQAAALQAAMSNQNADIAGLNNQLGAAQIGAQIGQWGTQNAMGANNMMLNNLQATANAGLLHQALDQQQINAQMQEWMFNQTSPFYTMQLYAGALAPPPGMPFAFEEGQSGAMSQGGSLPVGQWLQGAAASGFA